MADLWLPAGSRPLFGDINARVDTFKEASPTFHEGVHAFARLVFSYISNNETTNDDIVHWPLDQTPTLVYQMKSDRVQTRKLREGGRTLLHRFQQKPLLPGKNVNQLHV